MARKKELAKKEIYRLWWEYLHRSRRFKDFCKWIEKNKKMRDQEQNLFRFWDIVPQKFKITINSKGREFTNLFFPTIFLPFVFNKSFDEFCDEFGAFFDPSSIGEDNLVSEFITFIDIWFDQLLENYKNGWGRKPTVEEIRNSLKFRMRPYLIYFIHDCPFLSIEMLGKLVMKRIRMKRQDPEYQAGQSNLYPLKPVFDEVKRYLQVYDQVEDFRKRGGNWEEVFVHFHPEIAKKLSEFETLSVKEYDKQLRRKESCLRILKRDNAYAKKIISNVEKGIFPGNYH